MNQAERDQLERRPAALLGEHFARPMPQARPSAGAASATSTTSQGRPAPSASDTFKPAKPSTSDTRGRPGAVATSGRPIPDNKRPTKPVAGVDILALLILLALLVRK